MKSKKVIVAGGGVLGSQIALMCAYHGYNTVIWLRSEGSITRTKPKLELYTKMMFDDLMGTKTLLDNPMGKMLYPRGMIETFDGLTAAKIDELYEMGKRNIDENLSLELDLAEAVKDAYIVIETIAENLEVKIAFYEHLKDLLPEDTILCTNTSTLMPSAFAEHTGRPEKFLALHFANTIWKANTAEVMKHPGTDDAIFNEVVEFAKSIGMVPLKLYKEQPGYIINTLGVPFISAALYLWANDISDAPTIDLAWELGSGAPAGPFKQLDIVGLDTIYNIVSNQPNAQQEGTSEHTIVRKLKEKIDKGEKGLSFGKGFYDYSKK